MTTVIEVDEPVTSTLAVTDETAVEVPAPPADIIEVVVGGPQGPVGLTGPQGEPFIAPPVNLTDGAIIAVDASLGSVMRVTLGGNRTLAKPTDPSDSQMIMFEIKQDGVGTRLLALAPGYNFGTDLTVIQLSVAPNTTDRLLVQYVLARDEWDVLGFKKGY